MQTRSKSLLKKQWEEDKTQRSKLWTGNDENKVFKFKYEKLRFFNVYGASL